MKRAMMGLGWALISLGAAAQNALPVAYVGTWTLEWIAANGRPAEARLALPEQGMGSMQRISATPLAVAGDPCLGIKAPVHVQQVAPEQVILSVRASEVLAGCANSRLILRADADGKLRAHRGNGAELTIRGP